jgi:hypothetical protein
MPLLLVGPTKKARDSEKSQGLIASTPAFCGEHLRFTVGREADGRKVEE